MNIENNERENKMKKIETRIPAGQWAKHITEVSETAKTGYDWTGGFWTRAKWPTWPWDPWSRHAVRPARAEIRPNMGRRHDAWRIIWA
jgi:hypothetical protein